MEYVVLDQGLHLGAFETTWYRCVDLESDVLETEKYRAEIDLLDRRIDA